MHMTYIILLFERCINSKLFILFVVAFKTPFAVNFLLPSHALDKMRRSEKSKSE